MIMRFSAALLLLLFLCSTTAWALAPRTTSLSLDGATASAAHGINDSGTIVGNGTLAGGAQAAFIYTSEGTTWFVYPGAEMTAAWDINNSGLVAGWFIEDGNAYGFTCAASSCADNATEAFTVYAAPTADDTFLYGVNDAGTVVGSSTTGLLPVGFAADCADAACFRDITHPDAATVLPLGIGNDGNVVGQFHEGAQRTSFTASYDGSGFDFTFQGHALGGEDDLEFLTDTAGGFFVGNFGPALNSYRGALCTAALECEALPMPADAENFVVEGINEAGTFVGYSSTSAGTTQAFIGRQAMSLPPYLLFLE